MIKKLFIHNFRNIQEITIEPSQFINLISGNNGEGKSSILYAIEYLLTDNLNEKISEYVRWGCEKFYLEMEFIVGADNYYIKVVGDKSAKKELIINNDQDNIYKNSEATKKLAEIIDPNIIRYSSISEQGKTAQILFDTPTNRLKKLKEILGIDKLADLSEEIKKEIQDKEQTIKELNNEVKFLEEIKYNYIDRPDLPNIEEVKTKFELLEKDKQLYESQNKLYEKYLQEKELYDKTYKVIETNQEFILKYNVAIDELNKSQIEYNHKESEEELREQLSNYEKEKIDQEYKVDNYNRTQKRVKELNVIIEQQKQELDKLQLRRISICKFDNEDLLHYEDQVNENKVNLNTFEKELNLIEKGKCPTCGKDYIGNIEDIKSKIEESKSFISLYIGKVKETKNFIEEYNQAVNEQELTKVRRQSIQDKIDSYNKELNEKELEITQNFNQNDNAFLIDYTSLIKEINNKLENRKQVLLHNVQISNQVKELENKIKISQSLIEQVQDIKKPEQVDEPISFNFAEYENCKKEIIIYDQKVQERDRIIKHNEALDIERLTNNSRIDSLHKYIDNLSHEVSILKESRQILDKEFSAYLIDKGAEYIKDKMNEFFSQAYGKYTITFSQDKNSIDFFYSDGENISPCSMASGHEQKVLAIAFRIALSSLNNLGLMIFDEIDDAGSSEKGLQLYESILSNMSNNQIFAISHCEEVKEFLLQQQGSKEFNIVNGTLN
jgi:DNA repair exonuclease SbcCD ATPase subunit